jgi:microsomal dipeptidase-like Zn-dependent dipeptidase
MDKTALVEADLEVGREIVEALERSGIPIDLAAWLQDERLDWQLASSKAARVDK